ncbi:MAG: ABC transporter ATP-binding protein, partial [Microbacteriaceae bacterium]|nr:ABC transporter ATP-binding protein [Microbacteriaceae bacterium]
MSEMAQTADHVVVLGRGRVLADAPIDQILSGAGGRSVTVRTPSPDQLVAALSAPDVTVRQAADGSLSVSGVSAEQVGEAAARAGVVLHELTPITASLEQAYLELTQDDVEYKSEVSQ